MGTEGTQQEPTPAGDGQPQGQPAVPTGGDGGQPNDPKAMQADYTRKTQQLAEERKALEAQKTQLEAERRAWLQQQNLQRPTAQQPQQVDSVLEEQFGPDGARAIKGLLVQQQQQFQQSQFATLYDIEESKGKARFGEEAWSKHDYVDPMTGQRRNKVMDLRCAVNPITGQSLTLEQAWHAANPFDESSLKQKIKDELAAEMSKKNDATPSPASTSTPGGAATGHAKSIAEAFAQAEAQLGS